jgi:hypothetical protein
MTLISILARRPPWTRLATSTPTITNRLVFSTKFERARNMSNSAFTAKPFRLTLIQLGGVGEDKSANLAHAQEMVKKAVQPVDGKKTDLVVLPVSLQSTCNRGVVI